MRYTATATITMNINAKSIGSAKHVAENLTGGLAGLGMNGAGVISNNIESYDGKIENVAIGAIKKVEEE